MGCCKKKWRTTTGLPSTFGFDLNEFALQKNVSRVSPLYCYNIHQRSPEFASRFDLLFFV